MPTPQECSWRDYVRTTDNGTNCCYRRYGSAAVAVLEKAGHEVVLGYIEKSDLLSGALDGFDAIIVRSATKLTADVIEVSQGLSVIGRAGVGVDNIDLEAAGSAGIMVVNAPNASTQSVVELTIGHLLSSVRHIPKSDRSMRQISGKRKR